MPRSSRRAKAALVLAPGLAAVSTQFSSVFSTLPGAQQSAQSRLVATGTLQGGTLPAASTAARPSATVAQVGFVAGATGCAAIASRVGRRGIKRGERLAAQAEASETEWLPRTTGWDAADLAAERARASALEEPGSDYKGPRYPGAAGVTDSFIEALMSMQKEGGLLPKKDAFLLVLDVIDSLRTESTMGSVSIPKGKHVTVVGDLHGQYWDFLNILSLTGRPSAESPFIFNGDFVDRGSWSIEVILLVFALKLKDPQSVFLNRGNHEMLETNLLYGFCGEVGSKYDMELFNLFSEAFRNLPLCHLVEKKVLVLHGGLPGPDPRIWMPGQTHDPTDAIPMTAMHSLQDIQDVDRYMEITPEAYAESIGPCTPDKEVNDSRMIIDLLWGDPRGGDGYGPSYRRGKGIYTFGPDITIAFCEKNGLQCIVRSHEVKSEGWKWDHSQLLSVFSAPNYLDTGNNKGAFLKLTLPDPNGDVHFEPVTYSAVPHPDVPPMKWQELISESYPHLTRVMKKRISATFDEFGDSDFEGVGDLMNFDEWEPEEAAQFQDAFKVDQYGRELAETAKN